jgi:hypothetical protein
MKAAPPSWTSASRCSPGRNALVPTLARDLKVGHAGGDLISPFASSVVA